MSHKKHTECALHVDGDICMSKAVLKKILDHWKVSDLKELMQKLQVNSESHLIEHPEVVSLLGSGTVKNEIKANYKPLGPFSEIPLNDGEIDDVLDQWEIKWPKFCNLQITMIDFEDYGAALAVVDFHDLYHGKVAEIPLPLFHSKKEVGKPVNCVATVLNSDKHTGGGKHWTTIFIDMRPEDHITIEFFNSSGNPTYAEVLAWQEKQRIKLKEKFHKEVKIVQVSNVRHQFSDTECGPYALYFIYRRLNGDHYDNFKHTPIPDKTVTEFRKEIYREKK